eukprot:UN00530
MAFVPGSDAPPVYSTQPQNGAKTIVPPVMKGSKPKLVPNQPEEQKDKPEPVVSTASSFFSSFSLFGRRKKDAVKKKKSSSPTSST